MIDKSELKYYIKEPKILKPFENHSNYNCKITTDNDQEYLVYANWIHNNRLDNWKGWHCDSGFTRFYIDKNFDIWNGECQNTQLGNVLGEWEICTDNICKLETCTGCTDDLIVKKYKND